MSHTGTAPSTDAQLVAIASFSAVLDQHGLDYWLFGGWAVDFRVGAVTREHDDIDMVVWREDYDSIRAALGASGWCHTPVDNEVVGTRFRLGTAQIELTFVVADDTGRILIPVPDQPIVWSTQSFGQERRELLGVGSRTIPLGLLKAGKSLPRQGAIEAAKDSADLQALSQIES